MKSLNQFSQDNAGLTVSEMNKVKGGLHKVSTDRTYVENGVEYRIKTIDRKHAVISKVTIKTLK
ncbi:MAG: hypothetical protein AB8F95_00400 [Bacteroidia bacterium]